MAKTQMYLGHADTGQFVDISAEQMDSFGFNLCGLDCPMKLSAEGKEKQMFIFEPRNHPQEFNLRFMIQDDSERFVALRYDLNAAFHLAIRGRQDLNDAVLIDGPFRRLELDEIAATFGWKYNQNFEMNALDEEKVVVNYLKVWRRRRVGAILVESKADNIESNEHLVEGHQEQRLLRRVSVVGRAMKIYRVGKRDSTLRRFQRSRRLWSLLSRGSRSRERSRMQHSKGIIIMPNLPEVSDYRFKMEILNSRTGYQDYWQALCPDGMKILGFNLCDDEHSALSRKSNTPANFYNLDPTLEIPTFKQMPTFKRSMNIYPYTFSPRRKRVKLILRVTIYEEMLGISSFHSERDRIRNGHITLQYDPRAPVISIKGKRASDKLSGNNVYVMGTFKRLTVNEVSSILGRNFNASDEIAKSNDRNYDIEFHSHISRHPRRVGPNLRLRKGRKCHIPPRSRA